MHDRDYFDATFVLSALLNRLYNLPVDFRSRRFAFRGAGGEPPDMNETVKAPTPHPIWFCFLALLRREANLASLIWLDISQLARIAPSLAY